MLITCGGKGKRRRGERLHARGRRSPWRTWRRDAADHLALLLVGQLVQVHDHKAAGVADECHAFGARSDENAVATWHKIPMDEILNLVAQPSGLVDAVDEHDEGTHLVCLHEHLAPQIVLLASVRGLDVTFEESAAQALPDEEDDALHVHHNRDETDALLTREPEPVGERVHRLLRHPRLAGARPGAHEHGLCGMHAVVARGRGL